MQINLPDRKTIGVYLSGGVESSLLLYLCALQYPEKDIKACILIKPNRINLDVVDKVINWVENNTQKKILRENIFASPNWDPAKTIVSWARHLLHAKTIDILITGGNTYPIDELENMPVRQYLRMTNVYHPFEGILKTKIFEIYKTYGITDLLHLTHSCFDNMQTHCLSCTNCRERLWAHEKTGIPFKNFIKGL